jgi:CTP:molybdopterin cytidylyltransferase MocA
MQLHRSCSSVDHGGDGPMTPVAGLVLAGGAGRRFGGPKALAEIAGERLVDRAVRILREGGAAPVYIVSGAVDLDVDGAAVVTNRDWASGMGSSMRVGLAAMPAGVMAAVIVLVDQPGISAAAVARLVDVADGDAVLATATYGGRHGHPVLIGRDHWAEVVDSAVGDVGAREVLRRHASVVRRVECADVASMVDVDTPQELASFVERLP